MGASTMPSESQKPNGSSINIREYFTLWLNKHEQSDNDKFAMMESARVLAAEALKEHLAQLNEFKETMKDRDKTYFTRNEHEAYIIATEKDLRELRRFKDEMGNKASTGSVYIALVFSGIATAVSLLKIVIDVITTTK
jgi:hypothetical protein